MANSPLLAFLFLSSLSTTIAATPPPNLSLHYYAKTCPNFHQIMHDVVFTSQTTHPNTAAGLLRIFFHDCMVGGCDASLLISSTAHNNAEIEADLNGSLSGDGFDVVVRAKTALERHCPGVVSCADILAVATRDLITQVGGPAYEVKLGRRDGLESKASEVHGKLPRSNATTDDMISILASEGFDVREMVALTGGGHTIGFAHCNKFQKRIFGPKPDPSMHPKLANRLKALCANSSKDPDMAAFLDPISPGNFDNVIFKNLLNGLGVLGTDQVLASDPRTRPIVEEYARDRAVFFRDFAVAMEKVSVYQVKTGSEGEVRRRCDVVNTPQMGTRF